MACGPSRKRRLRRPALPSCGSAETPVGFAGADSRSGERYVHLAEPVYPTSFDLRVRGGPEVLQLDKAAIPQLSHFPEYRWHVDLADLGLEAARMVCYLNDLDQIPITFHMTDQVAIHALDVCGVEDHPYRSMTRRACNLAAVVEMGEQHACQRSRIRWFKTQREAFRSDDICCPAQIGDHRLDLAIPRA